MILAHVAFAHMLRQAGARGLLPREIIRRLRAITHWKRSVEIEVPGLLHHRDKVRDRNLSEDISRAFGVSHVASEQPGISLADSRESFAGYEMDDVIGVETGVGRSPSGNWNV